MYSRAVKTSIAYITMRFLKVLKLDQLVIVPMAMGSEVGAMKRKVLNLWRKTLGFPGGTSGKELACQFRRHKTTGLIPGIPWRRAWQPTPVFLLRHPHGQGRLVATVHGVAKSDNWSDLTHAYKEDPRFHFPLFPQISRQIPNALLVFYLRFLRDSLGFPGSLVGTESMC